MSTIDPSRPGSTIAQRVELRKSMAMAGIYFKWELT
jgi:hypothetical protein